MFSRKVDLKLRNSLIDPPKPKSYLLKDMQRKMDFLRTFLAGALHISETSTCHTSSYFPILNF